MIRINQSNHKQQRSSFTNEKYDFIVRIVTYRAVRYLHVYILYYCGDHSRGRQVPQRILGVVCGVFTYRILAGSFRVWATRVQTPVTWAPVW